MPGTVTVSDWAYASSLRVTMEVSIKSTMDAVVVGGGAHPIKEFHMSLPSLFTSLCTQLVTVT